MSFRYWRSSFERSAYPCRGDRQFEILLFTVEALLNGTARGDAVVDVHRTVAVYHDLYFVAGGDVHLHEEQAAFGELLFCYVPYFVCVHSVPLLFRPCV